MKPQGHHRRHPIPLGDSGIATGPLAAPVPRLLLSSDDLWVVRGVRVRTWGSVSPGQVR